MTIAIAGASGNLGRATADYLLERVDPSSVVLVTRDPAKLDLYAARGVTVRYGDFDRPESLPAALVGVQRLLLISATDIGRRVAQHVAAIDAAKAAGVRHVAYTSITNPSDSNPVVVAGEHRATEEALVSSGLAWTMLRHSVYAEIQVGALSGAIASGQYVHNHGDGASAFVARDDCAAVAAAVLATGGHEGRVYDVTGPELLSGDDLAAIATEVSGTRVTAVGVDDATYAAGLVEQAGLPEPVAVSLATFGQSIREGYLTALTTVVPELTGRPATPLRDVLAASLPVAVV